MSLFIVRTALFVGSFSLLCVAALLGMDLLLDWYYGRKGKR
jgi:hypothetical protein